MKNKIEKKFFPMIVSKAAGVEDSSADILARWDQFDLLGESEKNIIISPKIPSTIREIGDSFSLSDFSLEDIARIIRDIFFKVISKENLSNEIVKRNPQIQIEIAMQIANIIEKKVFELKTIKTVEHKLQLFVDEIVEKYPNLIEQHISSQSILLQNQLNAKPSIKNWIKDYEERAGKRKHSPIERGSYLFHSENGKKLSVDDRQKVGIILKSLDEKTPLTIDIEKQMVVFDEGNVVSTSSNETNSSELDGTKSSTINLRSIGQSSLPSNGIKPNLVRQEIKNDDAEDVFDRFYSRKPAPLKASLPAAEKPPVVLKNISFTPNIAKPTPLKNDVLENAGNLPQEKTYSIPQSKPPIGTQDYNVGEKKDEKPTQNQQIFQRPLGITNPPSRKISEPARQKLSEISPRSFSSPPIQREAKSISEKNNFKPQLQSTEKPKMEAEPEINFDAIQDRDSLSDEMLLKLYQQKKKNLPSSKLNISDTISYTKSSDNKNVVDLRNQN